MVKLSAFSRDKKELKQCDKNLGDLVWYGGSLCGWVVLVSVALVMPDCPAAGGAGKKADPERMFNAKDTNQDGWLSLDEFKVGGKEKKAKNADKRLQQGRCQWRRQGDARGIQDRR